MYALVLVLRVACARVLSYHAECDSSALSSHFTNSVVTVMYTVLFMALQGSRRITQYVMLGTPKAQSHIGPIT